MDSETADEIKRHLDVVAEGLRSEMKGAAELRSEMNDVAVRKPS